MDPSGRVTYAELVTAYLADCRRRDLRPATLRAYADVLARFARVTGAAHSGDLGLASGRAFVDAELAHLSPGSVAGHVVALRTFGRWLADEAYLESDPFARLRRPRSVRRHLAVFDDAQLAALDRAASPYWRPLIALLAGTGMRIGETCALTLADLRADGLLVRETKGREERLVPLDPALERMLRLYVARVRPPASAPGEQALFLTVRGRPLTPSAARQILRKIGVRAGVRDVRVSPHTFRHWYARDLVRHGTHPLVAAARGGWRSLAMLARYAEVSELDVRADTERYAPSRRLEGAGILSARTLLPHAARRR
jgi:integrase/recombinase XerD